MSKIYSSNGVRLDKMLAYRPGEVIDAVDPLLKVEGSLGYRWWRAQSVGALALNLMAGKQVLNVGGGTVSHWADDYEWTVETANQMAMGGAYANHQLPEQDLRRLAQAAGIKLDLFDTLELPVMVLALRDTSVTIPPAPVGFPGYRLERPVALDELDPFSVDTLQDMFEVPIYPLSSSFD